MAFSCGLVSFSKRRYVDSSSGSLEADLHVNEIPNCDMHPSEPTSVATSYHEAFEECLVVSPVLSLPGALPRTPDNLMTSVYTNTGDLTETVLLTRDNRAPEICTRQI
jgi:hypothetical protein